MFQTNPDKKFQLNREIQHLKKNIILIINKSERMCF